jgi:predicted TIM-barrel fold metal-dependent hydrolase
MTYANGRFVLDADSHVMESVDFLDEFLEPSEQERFRRGLKVVEKRVEAGQKRDAERRGDAGVAAEAEERLLLDKGWTAIGANDATERTRVIDLLGFEGQLVFPTYAGMFLLPLERIFPDNAAVTGDPALLQSWSSALNRKMAAFCARDPRMLPVGFVSLADPERAIDTAKEAIDLGCAALWIPSTPAGKLAPTHPSLDPFWALLESRDTPFVLHVGGSGSFSDPAFHNNERPIVEEPGDGERMRSKDFLTIYQSPALFLGALILDGLFDRFPKLRGACIEQGAAWVPSWLRHLDFAHRALSKTEAPLRRLKLKPSEYVRRHLKFTPHAGEAIGWIIEQGGPELFMFSSDYPHTEGTDDPIGRFENELHGIPEVDKERFYWRNMAELLGKQAMARA